MQIFIHFIIFRRRLTFNNIHTLYTYYHRCYYSAINIDFVHFDRSARRRAVLFTQLANVIDHYKITVMRRTAEDEATDKPTDRPGRRCSRVGRLLQLRYSYELPSDCPCPITIAHRENVKGKLSKFGHTNNSLHNHTQLRVAAAVNVNIIEPIDDDGFTIIIAAMPGCVVSDCRRNQVTFDDPTRNHETCNIAFLILSLITVAFMLWVRLCTPYNDDNSIWNVSKNVLAVHARPPNEQIKPNHH